MHVIFSDLKKFYWQIFSHLTVPEKAIQNEPQHDKTNKVIVRPVKTQISLGIRPV